MKCQLNKMKQKNETVKAKLAIIMMKVAKSRKILCSYFFKTFYVVKIFSAKSTVATTNRRFQICSKSTIKNSK